MSKPLDVNRQEGPCQFGVREKYPIASGSTLELSAAEGCYIPANQA